VGHTVPVSYAKVDMFHFSYRSLILIIHFRDEFVQTHLQGYKPFGTKRPTMAKKENINIDLPESVDWREKGIITEVRDQVRQISSTVLGTFPNDNFQSENFPNVQFTKRQLPKCTI